MSLSSLTKPLLDFIKNTYSKIDTYTGDDRNQLQKFDILFFCHDVDRGVTLGNKAYSPLIDSLKDYFEGKGLRCATIAHPFSRLTREHAHGSPISINKPYLISRVLTKFSPRMARSLSLTPTDLYKSILQKTRAKIVISIDTRRDLCVAAHDMEIFSLELLHGVSHTCLPAGWDVATSKELPNGILSLSPQSSLLFSNQTSPQIEVKTIPHPFLRRFTPARLSCLPKEWALPRTDRKKFQKEILITLMWGYAGDHGPNSPFDGILANGLFPEDLSWVIANRQDIFWRFRLHPVQLRDSKYAKLRQFTRNYVACHPNTEWEQSSTLPLPSVALHCAGNISMASSACYDAAAMGLKSLMLCPTLQNGGTNELLFEDLLHEGYIEKRTSSKKLISDWVDNAKKTEPRLLNIEDDAAWDEATSWILKAGRLSQTKQQTG